MAQRPTRSIDYSVQLSDVEAPVKGRGGELLIAAGQTEGATKAQTGRAIAGGLEFLGTTALGAYKGSMEAQVERDTNDALNKLEGVGTEAVAAEKNLANLRSGQFAEGVADQLTVLREQSGMEEPQLMKDFMGDISKYADAQKQGILSRGEVIARIASSVKKYSAQMPGWAGDFRKVAANLTGISNIDIYGIHTALTTKSLNERAQEKAMEIEMGLRREIAQEFGLTSLNEITPQMVAYHQQSKQLRMAATNAENKMKMVNMGQEEADKSWHSIATMKLSAAVGDVAKDIAKLGMLNQDPAKAMEAKDYGLQLSSKLAMTMASLERDVMEMTRPQPGRAALSAKRAGEIINEYRSVFKNYEDAVKNVEGRGMFAAMVKNANDRVDLLMNNFMLANPHVAVLNKVGSVSEIFKAYVSLGSEPEFEKRFGKPLAAAMKSVLTAPAAHASTFGAIAEGRNVDLAQVQNVSPELATVMAADLVHSVKEWAKDKAPTPQKKQVYSNVFATASKSLNPVVKRDIDTAYSLLADDDTQTFLGTLSNEQRANAVAPLVTNIQAAYRNVKAQIEAEINKFNDPDTNPQARGGGSLALQQNALTGAFEVVQLDARTSGIASTTVPGGGAVGMRTGSFNAVTRTEAAASRNRAVDLTGRLNRMLETYTLAARSMVPDGAPDLNTIRARVAEGQELDGRTQGGQVPTQDGKEAAIDLSKGLQAIQFAERTHEGKNVGESPKGAKGPFQFMPETAKAYGLKIDPQAGIDERTDLEKAGAAAQKMLTDLSKQFKGNIEYVAAAYNAGSGNVEKAIAKAKKLGVPDDWKSFLPKPEETVPYIRRFKTAYQNEQR